MVMVTFPAAWAGVRKRSFLLDSTFTLVALMPPTVTFLTWLNPLPVMVTVVPPLVEPVFGDTVVTLALDTAYAGDPLTTFSVVTRRITANSVRPTAINRTPIPLSCERPVWRFNQRLSSGAIGRHSWWMLIAFSVAPLGASESVADAVADAVRIVRESGLPNRTDSMFTTIEGEWDEVMDVVKRATEAVGAHAGRVSLVLKADIRPGHTGEIDAKVRRVEDRLASS